MSLFARLSLRVALDLACFLSPPPPPSSSRFSFDPENLLYGFHGRFPKSKRGIIHFTPFADVRRSRDLGFSVLLSSWGSTDLLNSSFVNVKCTTINILVSINSTLTLAALCSTTVPVFSSRCPMRAMRERQIELHRGRWTKDRRQVAQGD